MWSSPDGKLFYVADMMANGVCRSLSFTLRNYPHRKGHGFAQPRREVDYVSNWGEGSVSVVDLATRSRRRGKYRRLDRTWAGCRPTVPRLWLSGRYNREVYAFDTRDGQALAQSRWGKDRTARRLPATGSIFARTQRRVPVTASIRRPVRQRMRAGPGERTPSEPARTTPPPTTSHEAHDETLQALKPELVHAERDQHAAPPAAFV
jgi:hypothetical protein